MSCVNLSSFSNLYLSTSTKIFRLFTGTDGVGSRRTGRFLQVIQYIVSWCIAVMSICDLGWFIHGIHVYSYYRSEVMVCPWNDKFC